MTIYYRVNLQDGITTEERPVGYYSQHEDLNVTVFKNLRAAKREFYNQRKIAKQRNAELIVNAREQNRHLDKLNAKVRAIKSRESLIQEEKDQ